MFPAFPAQTGSSSFTEVPVDLILPGIVLEFPIYIPMGSVFRLFVDQGTLINLKHTHGLRQTGLTSVYLRSCDSQLFQDYVRKNLARVLQQEAIPSEDRFKCFYRASIDLAERVFRERLRHHSLRESDINKISDLVKKSLTFISTASTLPNMASLMEHNFATYSHCVQVFVYTCATLSLFKSVSDDDLFAVCLGAILHDLGKYRIPEKILEKPGKLSKEERRVVERHPLQGLALCVGLPLPKLSVDCIFCHHERADGSGYPLGLIDDEIPLPLKVVSVCDVYDALTSDRPYRSRMSSEEALGLMNGPMAVQFNREVLSKFSGIFTRY
jgi:HD-GYP domain-containing protein (c-di-GMP phosphodiesterase class II)